jgi:hypothetical protein
MGHGELGYATPLVSRSFDGVDGAQISRAIVFELSADSHLPRIVEDKNKLKGLKQVLQSLATREV